MTNAKTLTQLDVNAIESGRQLEDAGCRDSSGRVVLTLRRSGNGRTWLMPSKTGWRRIPGPEGDAIQQPFLWQARETAQRILAMGGFEVFEAQYNAERAIQKNRNHTLASAAKVWQTVYLPTLRPR